MDKKAVTKNVLTFLILFSLILITSFFLSHELNVNSQTSGSINGVNKNYDSLKNSVILTNSISSIPIANITLNTPIHNSVIRGKDRLVAEFTIDNYVSSSNVFNAMEFYDVKNNMKTISRTFIYKYKTHYNVEVPDYQKNCKERLNISGTTEKYDCVQNQVGTHTEQRAKWNAFDEKATLPEGSITLGIFTDVLPDETVEWIPTLYGIKINEWAEWTESFNDGLTGYWAMDEGSGSNVRESVFGLNNGTIFMSDRTVGKNGNAIGIRGSINSQIKTDNSTCNFSLDKPFSVGFWINRSVYSASTDNVILSKFNGTWTGSLGIQGWETGEVLRVAGGGSYYVEFLFMKNAVPKEARWTNVIPTSPSGKWEFYVFTYNGSNNINGLKFYQNGTDKGLPSASVNNAIDSINNLRPFVIGGNGTDNYAYGTGTTNSTIDEVFCFNKTLSGSEVSSLWNEGAGIFYQNTPQNQTSNITGYISWDGDFMTSGKINSTNLINTEMGYCVNGQVGITNNTGFWMCKDSACSSTCQVDIRGGIIVGCS